MTPEEEASTWQSYPNRRLVSLHNYANFAKRGRVKGSEFSCSLYRAPKRANYNVANEGRQDNVLFPPVDESFAIPSTATHPAAFILVPVETGRCACKSA